MSFRTLLLLFFFLLGLYGLLRFFSGRNGNAFEATLVQVDTAAVSSLVITLRDQDSRELSLQREGAGWLATDGVRSLRVPLSDIRSLLAQLTRIRTQNIASTDPEHWTDYGVGDEEGTRIQVYEGQKMVEDFILGRFSTDPQRRSGISYIRLTGQNEVYAIDGFQALSLSRGLDGYRNRKLLDISRATDVDSIEFQLADTTFRLSRSGNRWLLNGVAALDSVAVDSFVSTLCHLSGDQFADDFDELMADRIERQVLIFHSKLVPEPLMIEIFRDSTRSLPFVIRSSQFPENFFASDSSGLFRRLRPAF